MLTRRQMIQRCAFMSGGMVATVLLGACAQAPAERPAAPKEAPAAPPATAAPVVAKPTEAPAAVKPAEAAKPVAAGAPKRGGNLIYARTLEAPHINPHQGNLAAHRVLTLTYDTLLRLDNDLKIAPGLAERWEQPDPKTFVFHLRKDVKWHNGRAFDADDVKFSFEWILDEKSGHSQRGNFTLIDGIEVVDKHTARFALKGPNAGFPALVADIFSAVVAREHVEKEDPRQKTMGTGPFKLDTWIRDNQMKLVRNPDYYLKDRPYLDSLTIQVIPDEGNIVAGLRGGSIQHATFEDNKNHLVLKDQPSLQVHRGPRMGIEFLVINCSMKPFDDVRVRQAMAYAIDRQEVVQASLQGLGQLTGPLPLALKEWALPPESYETSKPNLDRAKTLLAEAGLAQGFKTELMVIPTFPTFVSSAQVIASQLRKINIDVSIVQVEYGIWLDRLGKTRDLPLTINATGGWADPDPYLYGRFHSKGFNQANWNEPEVEKLLEEGRATTEAAKRKETYARLQKMLADEKVPYVWLYSADLFDVNQNFVQGYRQHPSSFLFGMADTWVDK